MKLAQMKLAFSPFDLMGDVWNLPLLFRSVLADLGHLQKGKRQQPQDLHHPFIHSFAVQAFFCQHFLYLAGQRAVIRLIDLLFYLIEYAA